MDVAIVGGGVMGLAAAWRLAEAGTETVLFERFAIGHDRGSSGGPTRIYRTAYDHPAYVSMAQMALPMWRSLERTPEELVRITGGIDVGDQDELVRCEAAMTARGATAEWLESDEVRTRFPWFEPPPGRALYSPDTGIIAASAAVARLAERARAAGAEIREGVGVHALGTGDDGAVLHLDGGEPVRARRVVIAAGAWAPGLLEPLGLAPPLRVTQEQVFYVDGPPGTVPVITRGEHFFYTVPSFDGSGRIKVAEHVAGAEIAPDDKVATVDEATGAPVAAWARERLPGASPVGALGETCLYTLTPDEHFVLDVRAPVVIASPCSGHGFKFAPLIGQIVAALARDEEPPVDLQLFSLGRFRSG